MTIVNDCQVYIPPRAYYSKKIRLWGLIRFLSMRWKSRVGEFSWEWKKPVVVPVRETERAD